MALQTAWMRSGAGAGSILAVVVVAEALLFADSHAERWRKGLAPRGDPRTSDGEGLVIRCDGLGYYAWLRSALIDGDWSFDNEFDQHNPLGDYVPPAEPRTPVGARPNPWSVGPACVWSVAVVPGHAGLLALRCWGMPWPVDGYSLPYQLLVGSSTLVVSFLGLFLLYRSCRHFASPGPAALAAALLTLGTTVVYYAAVEPSMAHGVATAALAALVWYWLSSYSSPGSSRWLVVGMLVGAVALMRWQLATYAVLPAAEGLLACGRLLRRRCYWQAWQALAGLVLAAVGAVAVFLPQTAAWRSVYGRWLLAPYPTAHNWGRPSLWQVLLAQDRGFFYWTPLALAASLAACGLFRRQRADGAGDTCSDKSLEAARLLTGAFVLQVYVVASLWGAEAYLGASYGFRQLTESAVPLAPGLALWLGATSARRFRLLCMGGSLLVLWNLLLIAQYRYGWVPADGGADPGTLLANTVRLVHRKRALLLHQAVAAPLLLAVLGLSLGGRAVRVRRSSAAAPAPQLCGRP
jgi:hypothetical protein